MLNEATALVSFTVIFMRETNSLREKDVADRHFNKPLKVATIIQVINDAERI